MKTHRVLLTVASLAACILVSPASADLARSLADVEDDVIAWRRDIHQNPELSNREFRTAELVAEHLRSLGFDKVETGVAHTGVVGTLVGGKPGPTVALRAELDVVGRVLGAPPGVGGAPQGLVEGELEGLVEGDLAVFYILSGYLYLVIVCIYEDMRSQSVIDQPVIYRPY